jgi:hypothetical protein
MAPLKVHHGLLNRACVPREAKSARAAARLPQLLHNTVNTCPALIVVPNPLTPSAIG